jgi:hyaluronate lyase
MAYATPGVILYSNATLRADFFGALDWMYANFYNETKAEYNHWWHWEIGIPLG